MSIRPTVINGGQDIEYRWSCTTCRWRIEMRWPDCDTFTHEVVCPNCQTRYVCSGRHEMLDASGRLWDTLAASVEVATPQDSSAE